MTSPANGRVSEARATELGGGVGPERPSARRITTPRRTSCMRTQSATRTDCASPACWRHHAADPSTMAPEARSPAELSLAIPVIQRASADLALQRLELGSPAGDARGVAFDGTHVWVTASGDVPQDGGRLIKLNAADGTVVDSFEYAGNQLGQIVFDGSTVRMFRRFFDDPGWQVSNTGSCSIALPPHSVPSHLAFDGASIWVTAGGSNTVLRVAPNCAVLRALDVGSEPHGIAFDGASIWIASSGDDTIARVW